MRGRGIVYRNVLLRSLWRCHQPRPSFTAHSGLMNTSVAQQFGEGRDPSTGNCFHSLLPVIPILPRYHSDRSRECMEPDVLEQMCKKEGDARSSFVFPPPQAWPEYQLVVFPPQRQTKLHGGHRPLLHFFWSGSSDCLAWIKRRFPGRDPNKALPQTIS